MKNILVLGWYGTETLGDRAILDGIFQIMGNYFQGPFNVKLCSLHPFFTERTIYEDLIFYQSNTSALREISIIDEYQKKVIEHEILRVDLVIMGGGPIMNIQELKLISDYFKYAKKHNKKTIVLGCGLGPLSGNTYLSIAKCMLDNSSLIVFRDERSKRFAETLYGGDNNTFVLPDPAIISALNYKRHHNIVKQQYMVCNFRLSPRQEYGGQSYDEVQYFRTLLMKLQEQFYGCEVKMFPMHTFTIGGDDRLFLNKIKLGCVSDNIQVQNQPLSLEMLYKLLAGASMCVGMRYHSIVLGTLLCNHILALDYTDSKNGKIGGFFELLHQDPTRYRVTLNEAEDRRRVLNEKKSISEYEISTDLQVDCIIEKYVEAIQLIKNMQ